MSPRFKRRTECKAYFDEAEYALLRARAGGNISAYVRKLVLADLKPAKPAIAALRDEIPELITAADLEKPTKRVKECAHGTAKGYHCWQCGGLAKVESAT